MIRVGVLGYAGRMGSEVCRAVELDPDLELAARVEAGDSLDVLTEQGVDVAVDFTTPAAVRDNVRGCLERRVHVVVGTTGLTGEDLETIERWTRDCDANVFVAPNFAVGAVLMMKFAATAARWFDYAEIVERHHERKLDAPSGTAVRTAELMARARGAPFSDAAGSEAIPGSRGGRAEGVHVHSLRLAGSVAHHEVILGSPGQTLTIRHDSLDRGSFMPGVVLAIKKVSALDGLSVGLEKLLGL